jgi:hypothetical protein
MSDTTARAIPAVSELPDLRSPAMVRAINAERVLTLDQLAGTHRPAHDLDSELGYCTECWCVVPNIGVLNACDACRASAR